MSSDLHETIAERLRQVDQRYTTKRRDLVTLLESAGRPLTITEVLERRPDMPQSSAYRNLTLLESAGIVVRLSGTDEFARFELDENLTGHHHHHLICTECGAVADFTLPEDMERHLGTALHAASTRAAFNGVHHRLDIIGVCARCT